MRGHHELREAENLFALLRRSQTMLACFNMPDDELLQAMNIPADAKKERKDDARLGWYLSLVLEMEECRLSGRYALCFPDSKRARRHPYDLLARLPVQPDETERADVPDAFLTGLQAEEADEVRTKYARLLRIQPMRELFERLSELALPLQAKKTDEKTLRRELLEIIRRKTWRSPLPLTAEYGKATLDLADNNFSIIDRLIEMHRVPLLAQEQLLIPNGMLWRSDSPAVHIAAAVASSAMRSEALPKAPGMTDFTAPAGGHMAMGLYGEGSVGTLFSHLLADQKKRSAGSRIVHTRRYCRYQLMRFSTEDVRLMHDPSTLCGGQETRADAAERPEDIEPACAVPTEDWYGIVGRIRGLRAPEAPMAEPCERGLRLTDNGGNGAYRSLKAYFDAQREAQRRAANEETADADDILRRFLANDSMGAVGQSRAISHLQEMLQTCFREKRLNDLHNGHPIEAICSATDHFASRAGVLVLAYMCRTGGLTLSLPAEAKPDVSPAEDEPDATPAKDELDVTPAEVNAFLRMLREDKAFRQAFRAFSAAPAAAGTQFLLYTRVDEAVQDGRKVALLRVQRDIRRKHAALDGWFAADGTGDGFDAAAFTEYCRRGLLRFSFRRKNVAAKLAPFQVRPPRVFTEEDKALQLVLALFMMRRHRWRSELRIPFPQVAEAKVTDGLEGEVLVMQLCREVCELPEIDRKRMIERAKLHCLSILVGDEPGDYEEIFWLNPDRDNPVRSDHGEKKARRKAEKKALQAEITHMQG